MARFVCFGEVLMRLSAGRGDRLESSDALSLYVGGAEANVATLLARLGHTVKLVSVLPHGPLGDNCVRVLRSHGVDTSGVFRSEGRLGLYFTEAGAMMRPAKVTYDRAHSAFCEFDFSRLDWNDLLSDADWFHSSGITVALGNRPAQALLAGAQTAQKVGVNVSFDCNYRATLWQGREPEIILLMQEMVGLTDCLFAGRRDARYLLDQAVPRPDAVTHFPEICAAYGERWPNLRDIASTYREVLSDEHNRLTARLWHAGECFFSRCHDLNSIIDRIGAGDAFAGGLLHALSSGFEAQKIVDFAAASGAIKHSIAGDINRTDASEILAAINGNGNDISR